MLAFSNGVDEVRELQKKAKGAKPHQETCREYLLTVLQATDEVSQRRRREEILRGLLQNLFEKKDSERSFSPEQRRILWNSSEARKCQECSKVLTWSDLTIDHINPFSKDGRTQLDNAALMCRPCKEMILPPLGDCFIIVYLQSLVALGHLSICSLVLGFPSIIK
jgi:5-methylcytosine-specific restriction endonuclease McrA